MENKSNNTCCSSSCCGNNALRNEPWITGYKNTITARIPVVSTKLNFKDTLGNLKVRWDISRFNYKIEPGLYCVGDPDEGSPVLVTANYKLTFDKLRKELSGINAWILVLDTKGINVWCAAGKGTFGTEELINRIRLTNLETVINHKHLILPQLGASGVSAFKVKQETGFGSVFGPVYSKDIRYFLGNNLKKTKEMSLVRFGIKDRLDVIPVEFVQSWKFIFAAFIIISIINFAGSRVLSAKLLIDFIPYLGAFLIGTVIVPAFLPFIPFRSFSLKGLFTGIIWAAVSVLLFNPDMFTGISYFLIIPFVSAFLAMNFTGATTFTSLTGAKLEVKCTFFPSIISVCLGIVLMVLNIFI